MKDVIPASARSSSLSISDRSFSDSRALSFTMILPVLSVRSYLERQAWMHSPLFALLPARCSER